MYHYVKAVDPEVAINLDKPREDKSMNPVSDENMRGIARAVQNSGFNDSLVKKIRDYFNNEFREMKEEYNGLQGSWGSNGPNAPIEDEKWGALQWTQKFGVGYYVAYKGLLFKGI